MLLVAAFSFSFAACSDDEDEPKGEDIDMAGALNTVTVGTGEDVTIDVGCQVRCSYNYYYDSFNDIRVDGGHIVYAGDFQNLSSVTTAPRDITLHYDAFHDGGCYIVKSDTGKYIRFKVKASGVGTDEVKITYMFQTYVPTNI